MLEKDASKINIIIQYCDFIEKIMNNIDKSYDSFNTSFMIQQSISFNILQIGETVNKLSDEFKMENKEIEWHKIYAMRNYVVHNYGSIDKVAVFQTAKNDIPLLKNYCLSILKNQ